jgi:Tol biopolymer transport system component
MPRWSPDGTEIAYFAGTTWQSSRIYIVPSAGGKTRRATASEFAEWDPSWSPDGLRLAFGSGPGVEASTSANAAIRVMDLGTRAISMLPGSQGLFSPRFSPNGRHLAALSFDSQRLMLFDLATSKWTELYKGIVGWPNWSRDGRYLYWDNGTDLLRVRTDDRRVERVASTQGMNRSIGLLGGWFGLGPDDAPLLMRDIGTHEIYALDWEAP